MIFSNPFQKEGCIVHDCRSFSLSLKDFMKVLVLTKGRNQIQSRISVVKSSSRCVDKTIPGNLYFLRKRTTTLKRASLRWP